MYRIFSSYWLYGMSIILVQLLVVFLLLVFLVFKHVDRLFHILMLLQIMLVRQIDFLFLLKID